MPDALTLIVLVAAGEGGTASTHALSRAAHDALGSTAHVVVHEARGAPTDAEALAAERAEASDAVAELTWSEAGHRDAVLRVHLARSGRWLDRAIEFRGTDAEVERGRTLGFAIASILPQEQAATPSSGMPTPTPTPTSSTATLAAAPSGASPAAPTATSSPAPVPAATAPPRPSSDHAASVEAPASTPPAPAPPHAVAPAAEVPAPPSARPATPEPTSPAANDARHARLARFAIDMLVVAAPQRAGGFGVTLATQAFVLPPVAVRLVGGFRSATPFTSTPDKFTSTTWSVGGGIALYALRPSRAEPIGIWARADVLAENQELTRESASILGASNGPFVKWLVAFDGVADASFLVLEDVEAVAGGGVEVSRQEIAHQGPTADRLPLVRGIAELGIRLRF